MRDLLVCFALRRMLQVIDGFVCILQGVIIRSSSDYNEFALVLKGVSVSSLCLVCL